jgi:DNA repair protein RadA/Sms
VTVIGGEPGIGKSTLLLQVAAAMAETGLRLLYVSGEESKAQVRLRAERLGALRPRVWLATEFALPNVLGHVEALEPDVLIVDSIQTLHDPDTASAPGSVSQVRDCAQRLATVAKQRGLTVVLVGHVTKDGSLAGPRVLEHLVDTVLAFEGDRHHALRLVRALKHRFGATCELGLFEMHDHGLVDVPDPSELFLADRRGGVAGSVVVPTVDGHRPMLVELQALVIPTSVPPAPRRSAQGVDGGRLALLLAVLQRHARISAAKADVYASAVGGARVSEPGADLGLALAVASSVTGKPLPSDVVAIGEVGLAGEVRQVSQTPRRLAEAARLGFRRAVVASSSTDVGGDDVAVIGAATVSEALKVCGCTP